MSSVTDALRAIPDGVRKGIYAAYAVAVLAVGGVQVYNAALDNAQPDWVTGTLAVLAYLAVPFGITAAANVGPPPGD